MVAAIFGMAWTAWGASGLSGGTSVAVRIAGIAIGVVILARASRFRRSAPAGATSMFRSPAYGVVVALEVAALLGGAAILNVTNHGDYVPAWFAIVVGAHFLAFGRFFHARYYLLGVAMLAAGGAGAAVGLAGGGQNAIEATAGLLAAVSLFTAGASTVTGHRASTA